MLLQTVPWEKSLGHFKTLFNVTLGCLPETLSLQNKQVYWLQWKQSSEAAYKMELTPHCSFKRWRMNLYLKYVFFKSSLNIFSTDEKYIRGGGVVEKAVGNAGQMEGHENSKDRPSKSWQLTFRRTLERLGLHPTSKRWPKNQQNHTLLLMLQPLDISTLGWSLKRKLARVVLDDSI